MDRQKVDGPESKITLFQQSDDDRGAFVVNMPPSCYNFLLALSRLKAAFWLVIFRRGVESQLEHQRE